MANPKTESGNVKSRSVRVFSYGVFSIASAALASSFFPPVFTANSDRAVLNAPVDALTSPISGRILSIAERGEGANKRLVATIGNDRVDRSMLITLQAQAAAYENELRLKRAILADYTKRVADMEADLSSQRYALLRKSRLDLSSARAKLKIAEAYAANEIVDAKRNLLLLKKSLVAGSKEEFLNKIEQNNASIEAAQYEVERLSVSMEDAAKGIYFGEDQRSLDELQRDIRARKADLSQIAMEAASLQTKLANIQGLARIEERRIESLTRAEVSLEPSKVLFKIVAQVGKQVSAGDTIVESISCKGAFVVAIFSERQAQALGVGAPVTVSMSNGETLSGIVRQLVPRTTERVDLDYAVPFPPTERRELYAFISPDDKKLDPIQIKAFCNVGSWVSVQAPRQWVEDSRAFVDTLVAFARDNGPVVAANAATYSQAAANVVRQGAYSAWTGIDLALTEMGEFVGAPARAGNTPAQQFRSGRVQPRQNS